MKRVSRRLKKQMRRDMFLRHHAHAKLDWVIFLTQYRLWRGRSWSRSLL